MTTDDERELWVDLLGTKGWAQIVAWAQRDWAAQKEQAIARAADDTADAVALGKLRQILAADRAVQRVLGYPRERLEAIQRGIDTGQRPASLSRGGL